MVQRNYQAVDHTLDNLVKIDYPDAVTSTTHMAPLVPDNAPDFVKRVTAIMLAGSGPREDASKLNMRSVWSAAGTFGWVMLRAYCAPR